MTQSFISNTGISGRVKGLGQNYDSYGKQEGMSCKRSQIQVRLQPYLSKKKIHLLHLMGKYSKEKRNDKKL